MALERMVRAVARFTMFSCPHSYAIVQYSTCIVLVVSVAIDLSFLFTVSGIACIRTRTNCALFIYPLTGMIVFVCVIVECKDRRVGRGSRPGKSGRGSGQNTGKIHPADD